VEYEHIFLTKRHWFISI